MKLITKKEANSCIYRLFEIIPGVLTWTTLFICVFLTFIKPVWIAIFIICFDVYWLVKVTYLAVHLINSYKILQKNIKTDWITECKKLENWQKFYHLIILPTVKEDINILRSTLTALSRSHYPKNKMIIVLATEKRAGQEAQNRAKIIEKEFGDKFFCFRITVHPDDILGEVAGKGSNIAWAGKQIKKEVDNIKIPYENIIVSTFDIDTCVHPEYFGCLTYNFLIQPNNLRASYQPVPMYFNNIWDSPAMMRVVAMSNTFWMMMEQSRPEKLYTFSSHSMSFKALVDVDFWQTDMVSEDSRIFWQCFVKYDGDYRCVPLLIPVYMDTVLADTYWRSIINQYKQQRRWAWGVENIPYILINFINNKKISFKKRITHAFWCIEGFHSWATNAIIIFVLGWLPLIVGGNKFNITVLAQNLPFITQMLMTLATIGVLVSATLSMLLLPKRPKKHKKHRVLFMLLQWVFLPITTIILGSIPAIDAQTRLMLGKYMGFWVTEKVRK